MNSVISAPVEWIEAVGELRFNGDWIEGLTPAGRATVAALDLNHWRRQHIRAAEKRLGLLPPGGKF